MAALPAGATGPVVPPARTPGSYVVGLVCLGNICRSPTAHVVLEDRLTAAGLAVPEGPVRVTSSGTGGWHVGGSMDVRAAATLTDAGYDATRHRARQFDPDSPTERATDLVLAMDTSNLSTLRGLVDDPVRLAKFGDLDPDDPGADVPDPYYGGDDGFDEVLAQVERVADALVACLAEQRPWAAEDRS